MSVPNDWEKFREEIRLAVSYRLKILMFASQYMMGPVRLKEFLKKEKGEK